MRDAEARLEAVKAGQLRHELTFQELRSSGSNGNGSGTWKSSSGSATGTPRKALAATGSPSTLGALGVTLGGTGGAGGVMGAIEEPSREVNDQ